MAAWPVPCSCYEGCSRALFGPPAKRACASGASASPGGQTPATRSQQKKERVQELRRAKKGQKKVRKQADALEAALRTLDGALLSEVPCEEVVPPPPAQLSGHNDLALRICRAFRRRQQYRALPSAFGPGASRGLATVGSVLLRPPKYAEKFLPQEYSLLHKLWALVGGEDLAGTGVVDIGAGNANCAVLASALLGLTVLCVERESPRPELRAEAQLPAELRRRVVRIEADVADFSAAQLRELAAAHGLRRVALVAKHPCGIGADRSIECAARLLAPGALGSCEVLGAVLATCCINKLSLDDAKESRVREFCAAYAADLRPAFGGDLAQESLERAVETMSRCSAWRTAHGSLGNAISGEQLEWAELFEDALQSLRLRRLESLFGHVCEVRFAPSGCTLQDRCLIASARALPKGTWVRQEDDAFLEQVARAAAALLRDTGPIDCRPKGLKSEKYSFDYTDLAPPPE